MQYLERLMGMFQPKEKLEIKGRRIYSLLAEILLESMQGNNLTGEREKGKEIYELRRDERTIVASVTYPEGIKVEFMKLGGFVNTVSYVISRNVNGSSITGSNFETGEKSTISMTENPGAFGEGLDYFESEELARFHEAFRK